MSSAYCYILYSPSLDKYYVGSTTDIARRVQEHNRGKDKFTRTGRPWTLVYREEFERLIEARGRERYIKRMKSRKFIRSVEQGGEKSITILIGRVTGLNNVRITDTGYRESGVFFMSSVYCYILYSPSLDKYYVGSTTDIARKVQEHNRAKDKFTRTWP